MGRRFLLLVSVLLIASVGSLLFQPVSSQAVVTVTAAYPWQNNFSANPACNYPLNPYYCNEGPPVTIQGYMTTDGACTFLYADGGVNYVIWNLPRRQQYPSGAYEVYGYVYPDWPQNQPFPPYPFQKTVCVGVPVWLIPPFIQAYGANTNQPCIGMGCWGNNNGQTVTVYGYLPSVGDTSGCVNLYTSQDQLNVKAILWNVGSNYIPGFVAVTGVYEQMGGCGGRVLFVQSIVPG